MMYREKVLEKCVAAMQVARNYFHMNTSKVELFLCIVITNSRCAFEWLCLRAPFNFVTMHFSATNGNKC